MKNSKIRKLTGMSILLALVVVFGLLSNYIPGFAANINLALIPIIVAACLYGPVEGMILGLIDGVIILVAPATLGFFFSFKPITTIILCLVKTGAAGYVSGLLYKLLNKKNSLVAAIVAALVVPLVNTGIFLVAAILFYVPQYATIAPEGESVIAFIVAGTITLNFLFEFITSSVLSPVIHRIILIGQRRSGSNIEE